MTDFNHLSFLYLVLALQLKRRHDFQFDQLESGYKTAQDDSHNWMKKNIISKRKNQLENNGYQNFILFPITGVVLFFQTFPFNPKGFLFLFREAIKRKQKGQRLQKRNLCSVNSKRKKLPNSLSFFLQHFQG